MGETPSLTGEFVGKWARAEQGSCIVPPLAPPPLALGGGVVPKAPSPCNLSGVPRQRNMAQMKEQSKTPERELSDEEIANLSDAEFKTLVITTLTELIALG